MFFIRILFIRITRPKTSKNKNKFKNHAQVENFTASNVVLFTVTILKSYHCLRKVWWPGIFENLKIGNIDSVFRSNYGRDSAFRSKKTNLPVFLFPSWDSKTQNPNPDRRNPTPDLQNPTRPPKPDPTSKTRTTILDPRPEKSDPGPQNPTFNPAKPDLQPPKTRTQNPIPTHKTRPRPGKGLKSEQSITFWHLKVF